MTSEQSPSHKDHEAHLTLTTSKTRCVQTGCFKFFCLKMLRQTRTCWRQLWVTFWGLKWFVPVEELTAGNSLGPWMSSLGQILGRYWSEAGEIRLWVFLLLVGVLAVGLFTLSRISWGTGRNVGNRASPDFVEGLRPCCETSFLNLSHNFVLFRRHESLIVVNMLY